MPFNVHCSCYRQCQYFCLVCTYFCIMMLIFMLQKPFISQFGGSHLGFENSIIILQACVLFILSSYTTKAAPMFSLIFEPPEKISVFVHKSSFFFFKEIFFKETKIFCLLNFVSLTRWYFTDRLSNRRYLTHWASSYVVFKWLMCIVFNTYLCQLWKTEVAAMLWILWRFRTEV